ncbi:MAG: phage portal protein [Clostridiales bacterium]|nr:phage portal protein [Clostridiales bacterium]
MFTTVTYQDYLGAQDQPTLLLEAVKRYKASRGFQHALEANCYFRGENTQVARKTILRARKIETRDAQGRRRVRSAAEDVVGNRIGSSFLFRFVTQQNQFLLSEGVSLPQEVKRRLGADFDHQLERLGERALLHGCAWGYWNADHIEVIEAARNSWSGFFPLLDEMTGEAMLGVQFWQLAADRPMYLRVFSQEGVTLMRQDGDGLTLMTPCQPYRRSLRRDALGETTRTEPGYGRLPLIPLRANSDGLSEFTPAIRAKIDAYDAILSDFADNLDRANDVYWVLNNFGGTMDDVAEMLEQINRVKAVANLSDGTGSGASAEPKTIEVPYAARRAALDLLERSLYQDYMALDMDALTGSSLTNVAIRVAAANLNLKADRYEWQVRQFITELLRLIGCPCENVRFKRQAIANESETVADIAVMRQDIDQETALRLNPYISDEHIPGLLHSAAPGSRADAE